MKFKRAKHLDKFNVFVVVVEADCNDADYVNETNVVPFDEFHNNGWEKTLTTLNEASQYGREWSDKLSEDDYDNVVDLVPANIHDGLEVSISEVRVTYFNDKGEAFEVSL